MCFSRAGKRFGWSNLVSWLLFSMKNLRRVFCGRERHTQPNYEGRDPEPGFRVPMTCVARLSLPRGTYVEYIVKEELHRR